MLALFLAATALLTNIKIKPTCILDLPVSYTHQQTLYGAHSLQCNTRKYSQEKYKFVVYKLIESFHVIDCFEPREKIRVRVERESCGFFLFP